MQSRELVELAALVSAHGPVLIENRSPVSITALEDYWSASKCRVDRWGRTLKTCHADRALPDCPSGCDSLTAVLEEIFATEVLTRVWTAVLCSHDRRNAHEDAEIVSRSVMMAHMESRNRALRLLVESSAVTHREAVRINRLRRTSERWTDLLVGYLMGIADTGPFSVEPARARDFSEDIRYHGPLARGGPIWALLRSSLRAAFRQRIISDSPNADLNAKIAASVLACFPSELFDSTGLVRSLWLTRLANTATDAEGLLDELFAAEDRAGSDAGQFIVGRDGKAQRFG